MTAQTGTVTRHIETKAVIWDGTDAAWVAIEALDHDNCSPRRGGVYIYGTFYEFPIGHVVTTYDDGCLYSMPMAAADWAPNDEQDAS